MQIKNIKDITKQKYWVIWCNDGIYTAEIEEVIPYKDEFYKKIGVILKGNLIKSDGIEYLEINAINLKLKQIQESQYKAIYNLINDY
jgi:hypothetical protein